MRIAKVMLIEGTEEAAPAAVLSPATGPAGAPAMSRLSIVTVGVLGVLTLLLGIYWEPLRVFAERGLALL
jgi:hypothetical protein